MIEREIPKNILKHKNKFVGNFSLREAICGALGVGLAVGAYFTVGAELEDTLRMGVSFLIGMPFLLVGFIQLYEQPFEKMAYVILMENFFYPAKRPYETHYDAEKIENQEKQKKKKKKVTPSRKYRGIK